MKAVLLTPAPGNLFIRKYTGKTLAEQASTEGAGSEVRSRLHPGKRNPGSRRESAAEMHSGLHASLAPALPGVRLHTACISTDAWPGKNGFPGKRAGSRHVWQGLHA